MFDTDSENVTMESSAQVLEKEGSVSLLAKAEIDVQIATANAYPRSLKQFIDRALTIATINEKVAEACAYALQRGDKIIEGPSVRLAEIVFSTYRNLRGGMRIISNDGKTVTAQGVCHDLETNTCISLEVKRSILQHIWEDDPTRPGKRRRSGRMETMTEDMQLVTGAAACAIAFRNVVFKVVPSALVDDIYEKVKKVAMGTAETLPARRKKTLDFLHGINVTDAQICKVLHLQNIEDIDLEKLYILRGMCTLINNGEEMVNNLFPPLTAKDKGKGATKATEELLKKKQEKEDKTGNGETPTEVK
jgi:hypothetical protein